MSDKTQALLLSFLRVLAGCVITAITTVVGVKGYGPFDFTAGDWRGVGNALFGAIAVTGTNYLRPGETRFGRSSKDLGMGGEDQLEHPDGKINVETEKTITVHDHSVSAAGDEQPEQTDNRPRREDGEQLPGHLSGRYQEWDGGEMR